MSDPVARLNAALEGSGMNRRVVVLIGSLLLLLGCGGDDPTEPDTPLVLQPSDLCSDHSEQDIATFEEANLEAVIRTTLGVGAEEDLTCRLMSGLTRLDARFSGIESLVGIQNLVSLTVLDLYNNSISDISVLSGLTILKHIHLSDNQITDISALSGLTSLTLLDLRSNSLTDISALSGLTTLRELWLDDNPNLSNIQPLLSNAGLGADDTVFLARTMVSCADVAALQAKGVDVRSDCP